MIFVSICGVGSSFRIICIGKFGKLLVDMGWWIFCGLMVVGYV